ncbi:MAG: hypothetical protein K6F82_04345 [Sphaerochaetaceae bacterium]|nr:hypothetical protein [Sphaerochaetaceae bacterium]
MGSENILILGYERRDGGLKNALYYASLGCNVRLTDLKDLKSLGEGAEFLKSHGVEIISDGYREEDFKWADKVVKTPAIDFSNEYLKYAKNVVSSFSELLSSPLIKETKIILISGIKGKTIAASAISHTLKAFGHTVHTCGNLGRSAYAELALLNRGEIPQYLICEFSSRQLRDALYILGEDFPDVELSLITGYNQETDEAVKGKETVYARKSAKIVCPQEMRKPLARIIDKKLSAISSIEALSKSMSSEIPESLRNAYAVLSAIGIPAGKRSQGLKSFRGVPNQSEIILMNGEIIAVNDSSATIPESVVFAYQQFASLPVHIICGGTGRNLDSSCLINSLSHCASVTLLDGSFTRSALMPLLQKNGISFNGPFIKMEDAVNAAFMGTDPNDGKQEVILLSPGAMAYEYFSDEFERGDLFARACKALDE